MNYELGKLNRVYIVGDSVACSIIIIMRDSKLLLPMSIQSPNQFEFAIYESHDKNFNHECCIKFFIIFY